MRRIILAAIAACALSAGSLAPQHAQAMPVSTPLAATIDTSLLQQAAYQCRPIWRCGRYGCGWRQVCYWTPYPRWGGPGWRWRHRHWRHRW
jgi:hypothetical protein